MKQVPYSIYLFCLLAIIWTGCRTSPAKTADGILFLNKEEGAKLISQDSTEDFFGQIQVKDIALQMSLQDSIPLDEARNLYRQSLGNAVLDFSIAEAQSTSKILEQWQKEIRHLNPNILPHSIQVIKVKPEHYGDGVFYTRDNAIIIPSDMLEESSHRFLKDILLHEIFHIISRQRQGAFRDSLYGIYGFKRLEHEVIIPKEIQENTILNPDGIDQNWYIPSQSGEQKISLVPLLQYQPNPSSKAFFEQVELRFFKILDNKDGFYLNANEYLLEHQIEDFRLQVGNNTDYIIHPEEIAAENFVLAMKYLKQPKNYQDIEAKDKELLEELIRLLRKR